MRERSPGIIPGDPQLTLCAEKMEVFERNTHAFLVKIWLEETAEEAGEPIWRGHITHLQSGEQRYLQDSLDMMSEFIESYMLRMGIKVEPRSGRLHPKTTGSKDRQPGASGSQAGLES